MSLLSARAPKINFADESRRGLLRRRANRVRLSLVAPSPCCSCCLCTSVRAACVCVCVLVSEQVWGARMCVCSFARIRTFTGADYFRAAKVWRGCLRTYRTYVCMYIHTDVSKIFPTVADTSGCNSFCRVHYIIIYANTDTLCYLLNICFCQLDTHYPYNLIWYVCKCM